MISDRIHKKQTSLKYVDCKFMRIELLICLNPGWTALSWNSPSDDLHDAIPDFGHLPRQSSLENYFSSNLNDASVGVASGSSTGASGGSSDVRGDGSIDGMGHSYVRDGSNGLAGASSSLVTNRKSNGFNFTDGRDGNLDINGAGEEVNADVNGEEMPFFLARW
jgi:hypothetical protein